jgi:hypothetical protein
LVESRNHIFQEVDQHNDFGIDGYIEFAEHGRTTGLAVAVQVKSGRSYLDTMTGCGQARCGSKHLEYWDAHVLPVALIVHDPDRGQSWWADVRAATAGTSTDHTGSRVIGVNTRLDDNTFDGFLAHFQRVAAEQKSEVHFGKVMILLGDRSNDDAFFEACRALFQSHRGGRTYELQPPGPVRTIPGPE